MKKKDDKKVSDDKINYSDIPELDEKFWSNAVVHYPKKKHSLTIRLDEDILEWFKQQGPGYQTHINAVLKTYMLQHKYNK